MDALFWSELYPLPQRARLWDGKGNTNRHVLN